MTINWHSSDEYRNDYYCLADRLTVDHRSCRKEQAEFLDAVNQQDWPTIKATLKADVPPKDASPLPTVFTRPQSYNDLRELPPDIAATVRDAVGDITPRQRADATFWRSLTLQAMEQDQLDMLEVMHGGPAPGNRDGAGRLELLRNLLRRMSGLEPRRGVRSVYTDGILHRAWEAEQLRRECEEVHGLSPEDNDKVWDLLATRAALTRLLETFIARNRYGGNAAVRTAITVEIALKAAEATRALSGKAISQQLRAIATEVSSREPAALTAKELRGIVRQAIE